MKTKKAKVKDLQDGDIFYINEFSIENEDIQGCHSDLSGIDDIFIVDDIDDITSHIIVYVNGGHEVHLKHENTVYILGHYSELLKNIKNNK